MKIEQKLLTPNAYSRPQSKIKQVKKIVVHYVGNAKSSAIANRNYFESLKDKQSTYASSHYIIGLEGEIILCVPEGEVAYHAKTANTYSIGIECCHPDWSGKFNDKTYKALLELCIDLCKRYNLNPVTDIIRHYDAEGCNNKPCPLYWVDNPSKFTDFRQDVKLSMTDVDEDYKKAVDVLIDKGIIGSPASWFPVGNIKAGNVPSLIKKVANYINK